MRRQSAARPAGSAASSARSACLALTAAGRARRAGRRPATPDSPEVELIYSLPDGPLVSPEALAVPSAGAPPA
eukprot:1715264-Alexandrium_andersonii.AAC.1